MKPEIGWKVPDCYMQGIGGIRNQNHPGIIEEVGDNYVKVTNSVTGELLHIKIRTGWENTDGYWVIPEELRPRPVQVEKVIEPVVEEVKKKVITADSMNVWAWDIECYSGVFMLLAKKRGQDKWKEFVVSQYENNLGSMIKWLLEVPDDLYMCGFNNNSYDMQVIQYIMDTYDKWYDLGSMEVVDRIRQFSNDLIDNQNYDNHKLPYMEHQFDVKQIDLMSIHGYTNENKRVSLKWLEFMTDMEVDETPVPFNKADLSSEEVEIVKMYCRNDIMATEKLYEYTRGNCDNILYKGKDKIQERLDTIEEFGLKSQAINHSDVKIGEMINLLGYMKEAGIQSMSTLYDKKKNRKPTKQFTFGDCIPKYVKFQTDDLKAFHNRMKKVVVNLHSKEEYPVIIEGMVYTIAKGGLHTVNKPVILEATDEYDLTEFDVSSQYPASLIKRQLYPSHLGKSWLDNYKKLVQMRLDAKAKGKKEPRYKGISESLKLSINGGAFGKLNDTYSLQYDPYPHFQCTIGNQFEILMLIEWMIIDGISILSANTDGALCKVPVNKRDKFYELCKKWEELVGNTVIGQLEYTKYSKYIMTTVNDYIAVKTDGELKQKGDFLTDHELNKNKSKRIVPIALREYWVNGTPVEQTIENWPSIWEFGIAKKSSRDYYYQGVDRKTGKVQKYDKLVRYYCSTKDIGEKIYKCKHEHSEKKGVKMSMCESTSEKQVLFNKPLEYKDIKELKIDYPWYISETKKIIYQLLPEVKRLDTFKKKQQIDMFS